MEAMMECKISNGNNTFYSMLQNERHDLLTWGCHLYNSLKDFIPIDKTD